MMLCYNIINYMRLVLSQIHENIPFKENLAHLKNIPLKKFRLYGSFKSSYMYHQAYTVS